MRLLFPILVAAIGLVGCKSSPPQKPAASDTFHEKEIYAALKSEPVPLPQSTPYDGDVRQREAFNEGFRGGWDRPISGALLNGTFGTPTDLPKDLRDAWRAGWQPGAKGGSGRWFAESKREQETLGQPGGTSNRSHLVRSDTNQTSAAAGSDR